MVCTVVMLTASTVSIFLLSVVFTKADEITNEIYSQKVAVPGSQTGYDQVECCCVIRDRSFHSFDSAVVLLII